MLERVLPKGSWVSGHPDLTLRPELGDLLIEVDQLEAVLTGILRLDNRRWAVARTLVNDQFTAVELELEKFHGDRDLDDLRGYVRELRSAYDRHLEERKMNVRGS